MTRVYIDAAPEGDSALLSIEDSQHVARVLRMTEGQGLLVCDGCGHEFDAVITRLDKSDKQVEVRLENRRDMDVEPHTRVTLYQAMPKTGKLEYVLQKCTEVGVARFVPFYSSRCVSKPSGRDKDERYARIAREAAKQCGRGILPGVAAAISFEQALEALKKHQLVILPWEEAAQGGIRQLLNSGANKNAADIAIVIGPEGGFDKAEVIKMTASGANVVTLGKRILRTETAGLVAASLVLYEMGELG